MMSDSVNCGGWPQFENEIASAVEMLGFLCDPETLVAFAQIMSEPDEDIARGMIKRMEQWFATEFAANAAKQTEGDHSLISQRHAARHARQIADQVRDAWVTLHQAKGEA